MMDNAAARAILLKELSAYRDRSYAELTALIGPEAFRREVTQDGVTYQLVIDLVWDDQPNGPVRVIGSVDNGGWRAFVPVSESFIKAPDGSFVDE